MFSKEVITNIFSEFMSEMIEKYILKQKDYQDNWFEIVHIDEMISDLKDSLESHIHQWNYDNQLVDIANYCLFIHTLQKLRKMDSQELNHWKYQIKLKNGSE